MREVDELHSVDGLIELGVEVVDPELVEVAQDDVPRSVGDGPGPVIECLLVVPREVGAGLLHLDDDSRLPHQVGERDALRTRTLADS